MADLLGSILGSMEKPPSLTSEEKRKIQEQKQKIKKLEQEEKDNLNHFKLKIRAQVKEFVKDSSKQKLKFPSMDKVYRAVIHDVAEVAGLAAFSFGEDGVDRYIMLWKKEFAPCDDELAATRRGEEWSAEKAEQLRIQREQAERELAESARAKPEKVEPECNYKDKYERLIGREAGVRAADTMSTNKAYGFVSSANKKDVRTIEQVMADNRARKKLKTQHGNDVSKACPGESNTSTEVVNHT